MRDLGLAVVVHQQRGPGGQAPARRGAGRRPDVPDGRAEERAVARGVHGDARAHEDVLVVVARAEVLAVVVAAVVVVLRVEVGRSIDVCVSDQGAVLRRRELPVAVVQRGVVGLRSSGGCNISGSGLGSRGGGRDGGGALLLRDRGPDALGHARGLADPVEAPSDDIVVEARAERADQSRASRRSRRPRSRRAPSRRSLRNRRRGRERRPRPAGRRAAPWRAPPPRPPRPPARRRRPRAPPPTSCSRFRAEGAATAIGANAVVKATPGGGPRGRTDWDDLSEGPRLRGLEEVAE